MYIFQIKAFNIFKYKISHVFIGSIKLFMSFHLYKRRSILILEGDAMDYLYGYRKNELCSRLFPLPDYSTSHVIW